MTIEAHSVHIDNLYKRLEQLADDCENQHKTALDATLRLHQRIDEFTRVMVQLSEVNKDVQSLITHQRTLEARLEALATRVNVLELATAANTDTSNWLKKIAWALGLGFGGLVGGTLWQVILAAPK